MQGSPTSIIQGHVLRESQLSGVNKKKKTRFKLYKHSFRFDIDVTSSNCTYWYFLDFERNSI